MKTSLILTFGLCISLFGSVPIFGQEPDSKPATVKRTATLKIDKSNVKVQRHTVMSRFEPEIASTEEERMKKRQERIAATELKLRILDTLDISERRKRMLLRDLKHTPYSTRLSKATLVDTQFEDTSNNN
ncbi:hypothetical protein [Maribacter sp. 2308TA10-17]|uniref:hypothetical protein n=1 Tax=Maribacter sp. 2308TA10-17 TaxID=3386276 RepID=UPI0039BD6FA6